MRQKIQLLEIPTKLDVGCACVSKRRQQTVSIYTNLIKFSAMNFRLKRILFLLFSSLCAAGKWNNCATRISTLHDYACEWVSWVESIYENHENVICTWASARVYTCVLFHSFFPRMKHTIWIQTTCMYQLLWIKSHVLRNDAEMCRCNAHKRWTRPSLNADIWSELNWMAHSASA